MEYFFLYGLSDRPMEEETSVLECLDGVDWVIIPENNLFGVAGLRSILDPSQNAICRV